MVFKWLHANKLVLHIRIKCKESISPYCRLSNLLPVLSLFISKPLLPCLVPEKKTYSQYCFCYWDTSLEGYLGKEKGEMKGKKKKTCKIPEHTEQQNLYKGCNSP
jgi:hypothetical protein